MNQTNSVSVERIEPKSRQFFDEAVIQCLWNPHENHCAIITADGGLHLSTPTDAKKTLSVAAHEFGVHRISWSPDGLHLASAGQDGVVKIWRSRTLLKVAEFSVSKQWVEHLAWQSPTKLAACAGREAFLIDLEFSDVTLLAQELSTINGIAAAKSGVFVLITNGRASRVNCTQGKVSKLGVFEYPEAMLTLALSPDSHFAAIGCQDSAARVWTIAVDNDAVQMSGHDQKVEVLGWSSSSEQLAIAGGAQLNIWSFIGQGPRHTKPLELFGHRDTIRSLQFAPLQRHLASVDKSGLLCLWDLESGIQTPRAAALNSAEFYSCSWSYDSRFLVTGDAEGSMCLWDFQRKRNG
jgi:WD40 repeat protein